MISVKNPTSLRATDLKIGDKVVADKDAHGSCLEPGKTYIVKSFANTRTPMGSDEKCIAVTTEDGGFAGSHYVCRFNKKSGVIKASDLKVGDRLRATEPMVLLHGSAHVGDEFEVTKVFNSSVKARHLPSGQRDIGMSNGAGNYLACVEKIEPFNPFEPFEPLEPFEVGDRVAPREGVRLPYSFSSLPGGFPKGARVKALRDGHNHFNPILVEFDGYPDLSFEPEWLELVKGAEPKPEPRTTMTKRILTDVTVRCASGDGSSLLIGYDPTGNKDNDGPCVDFEAVDVTGEFNCIDIEDIETLDAVIKALQAMREDFVKDGGRDAKQG